MEWLCMLLGIIGAIILGYLFGTSSTYKIMSNSHKEGDKTMESYLDYIKGLYEDLEQRVTELEETYEPSQKPKQTEITSSDLLFLASLFEYFGKHSYGDVTIDGTTVTLHIYFYDKNLIEHRLLSSFDLNLCSKYYNRVSKFVEEVL